MQLSARCSTDDWLRAQSEMGLRGSTSSSSGSNEEDCNVLGVQPQLFVEIKGIVNVNSDPPTNRNTDEITKSHNTTPYTAVYNENNTEESR